MKLIRTNYLGMIGEGENKRAAREDAERKITVALASTYTPKLITFNGHGIIIWMTPTELVSAHVYGDHYGGHCLHGHRDWDKVEREAKFCLAQLGGDVMSNTLPQVINLPGLESEQDHYWSWVGFQRAYRQGKTDGLNDTEAHRFACEHSRKFNPYAK